MEEHITAERIAVSIMVDSSRKPTIMLVEGTNDNLLFSKFIEPSDCEIKIAFGYQRIYDVIESVQAKDPTINIIGIIDQDFLGVNAELPLIKNVFFVDEHDLELMVLKSRALNTLMVRYGNNEKIRAVTNNGEANLLQLFLDTIFPLAVLRYVNFKYSLGITFKPKRHDGKKMKFDFIDEHSLEFRSPQRMIDVVFNYTAGKSAPNIERHECLVLLEQHLSEEFDFHKLCNGHDICRLISISLRRHTGAMGSRAPDDEEVEKTLMMAYDSQYFLLTDLYSRLKQYESDTGLAFLAV